MTMRLRLRTTMTKSPKRPGWFSLRLPGGALFSSPKTPSIPPPPPIPEPADGEDERRERLLAEKRRRGTRATILTGGLGVLDAAPIQRRTLG